jgi:hypothetical protein
MVLVQHHAVKSQLIGIGKLVDILLIETAGLLIIPQAVGHCDPTRVMFLVKILGQKGIGHEMPAKELNRFHR